MRFLTACCASACIGCLAASGALAENPEEIVITATGCGTIDLFPFVDAPDTPASDAGEDGLPYDVDTLLAELWSPDRPTRLEAAKLAGEFLSEVELDPSAAPRLDAVQASLRAIFAGSSDEWFLDRLSSSLIDGAVEFVEPLFRELLAHPSANVRRRAIQYYAEFEQPQAVPQLLELWRDETRPPLQVDLMDALEMQDSDAFLSDCAALAGSDDPGLAVAAIERLDGTEVDGALQAILGRTQAETANVRAAVAGALGRYPGSRAALDALLALSFDRDFSVVAASVDSLAGFAEPEARARLEDLLTDASPAWPIRFRSFIALAESPDPGVWRTLLAASATSPFDIYPQIEGFVEHAVQNPGHDAPPPKILTDLAEVSAAERWYVVEPAATNATVRCWAGPWVAGDPDVNRRLPRGVLTIVADRFESEAGPWVELETHDCWVPLDSLRPLEGAAAASARQPAAGDARDGLVSWEIDLTKAEAESRLAMDLQSSGFLRQLDAADGVVGVAIEVDPRDLEAIDRYFDLYQPGNSLLQRATHRVLAALLGYLRPPTDRAARLEALVNRGFEAQLDPPSLPDRTPVR